MRVRSYFRYKNSDPARVVIQLLTFLRCQEGEFQIVIAQASLL